MFTPGQVVCLLYDEEDPDGDVIQEVTRPIRVVSVGLGHENEKVVFFSYVKVDWPMTDGGEWFICLEDIHGYRFPSPGEEKDGYY